MCPFRLCLLVALVVKKKDKMTREIPGVSLWRSRSYGLWRRVLCLIELYRRFGATSWPKTETIGAFKTFLLIKSTRRHNPQDCNLHSPSSEAQTSKLHFCRLPVTPVTKRRMAGWVERAAREDDGLVKKWEWMNNVQDTIESLRIVYSGEILWIRLWNMSFALLGCYAASIGS